MFRSHRTFIGQLNIGIRLVIELLVWIHASATRLNPNCMYTRTQNRMHTVKIHVACCLLEYDAVSFWFYGRLRNSIKKYMKCFMTNQTSGNRPRTGFLRNLP
jgi:hypothetical protein